MRYILLSISILLLLLTSISAAEKSKLPEGYSGISSNYPEDNGIDKDPNVIFASGFEDGFSGWTGHPKTSKIISDAHSGKSAAQIVATRGKNSGGDIFFKLPEGQEKIHFRFYCKIAEDSVIPHHFAKIHAFRPGFRMAGLAGKAPAGKDAFWTGIEPNGNCTWKFYTYWHEMHSWQTPEGKRDGRPNPYYGNVFTPASQKKFNKGEWICVEAMLKCNTIGKADGEQAFWINGKLVGHWKKGEPMGTWIRERFVTSGIWNKHPAPFEGYNFRTAENVLIRRAVLQWYVSQKVAKKGKSDKNICSFDDVVIAKEYIGPQLKK